MDVDGSAVLTISYAVACHARPYRNVDRTIRFKCQLYIILRICSTRTLGSEGVRAPRAIASSLWHLGARTELPRKRGIAVSFPAYMEGVGGNLLVLRSI